MRLKEVFPGAAGVLTSLGASICCLIPLAVIYLGLGTGAFMATTMKYRPIVFPLGVIGLGAGYFLYFRERKRCRRVATKTAKRFSNKSSLNFSRSSLYWRYATYGKKIAIKIVRSFQKSISCHTFSSFTRDL